uniref:Putative secreted protein n=1 Tax=Anopheles marajoara TaxID=58244 RepID=A0A2M4CDH7_9DIPT
MLPLPLMLLLLLLLDLHFAGKLIPFSNISYRELRVEPRQWQEAAGCSLVSRTNELPAEFCVFATRIHHHPGF